jgi:hypothetical protein
MIEDEAFSYSADPTQTRVAVHCLGCRQAFHPGASNLEPGMLSAQGLTTT